MAGFPNRRAARLAELMRGTELVPLPDDWHARSVKQRLEANLGLSIDRCHQILNLPLETATPGQLSAIKEVALAHINAGFRFMFNQQRDAERDRVLEEMARELRPDDSREHAASGSEAARDDGLGADTAASHSIKRQQHQ